jgi:hypothetical protein
MRRVFSTARKVASDVLYDLTAVEGLARCCASLLLRPGCPGTVLVRARRLSFVRAHRLYLSLCVCGGLRVARRARGARSFLVNPPSAVSKVADPLTERAPGCRAAFVAALERRGAAVTVAALPPVPLSVRSVSKGPLDCPPIAASHWSNIFSVSSLSLSFLYSSSVSLNSLSLAQASSYSISGRQEETVLVTAEWEKVPPSAEGDEIQP